MDLSELSSSTREILDCSWGWPSVRMRDSLNHIQGNDLGAGRIDHHTDLLLLFALLYGMVNLSDLPIVERRRSKPCLNLSCCTRQLLPIVGYTVRFNPDPFSTGETINGWPPWDIDSWLVLAPDRQLRRPSHGRTLPRWKDRSIEEKVMPLPEEPREGIFPRIWEDWHCQQ